MLKIAYIDMIQANLPKSNLILKPKKGVNRDNGQRSFKEILHHAMGSKS